MYIPISNIKYIFIYIYNLKMFFIIPTLLLFFLTVINYAMPVINIIVQFNLLITNGHKRTHYGVYVYITILSITTNAVSNVSCIVSTDGTNFLERVNCWIE